jgi:lipopolysaccharide export system permease protein
MVGSSIAGRFVAHNFVATSHADPLASETKIYMKILDLYIGTRFLRGVFLIVLVLVALFSFLELVSQLSDVGKGYYTLKDAFIFVGLTLPRRVLDLMPICTLLGSIVALGLLADHRELLAMQVGGFSVRRICWSVFISGTILILATGMLAEIVVPPMDQQARTRRLLALNGKRVTLTKQGFWARRGSSYIHVGKTLYGGNAADLNIFECDEQGRLRSYTHAREANIKDNNQWVLRGITQKVITEQGITTQHLPSLKLDSFLSSDQVNILELPPDSLSSADLHHFIQALKESGQNTDRYSLAFWRKLTIPLTTGAMVLLSLPFLFGSTRRKGAGKRITLGATIGIVLYFADQVIIHLGLLFSLNPFVTAVVPVVSISSIALWQMRRFT